MLFRRSSRRPDDGLRRCPSCRSRLVCPVDWEPTDDEHWYIELRCGDCGDRWERVIDNARAKRFDLELGSDEALLRRALATLDRERMIVEVEAFATALSRDLIEPADFAV